MTDAMKLAERLESAADAIDEIEDIDGQTFEPDTPAGLREAAAALRTLTARNAELVALLGEALPFVGYQMHVPELIARIERAIGDQPVRCRDTIGPCGCWETEFCPGYGPNDPPTDGQPAGVVVPEQPTEEMMREGADYLPVPPGGAANKCAGNVYRAMLSARPR